MEFLASIPGWAIGGVVIGLFGALAGAIGAFIVRTGHKWGRLMRVVTIGAAVALSSDGRLVEWIRAQTVSPSAVGDALKDESPALFSLQETSFPETYHLITTRTAELLRNGATPAEVQANLSASTSGIQRQNAAVLANANDEGHEAIIADSIAFHRALLAADPELCSQVAVAGPAALAASSGNDAIKAMVEPQALNLSCAIANARVSPVQRPASMKADWDRLVDDMIARGVTAEQFAALDTLDPNSTDLCPAVIAMLEDSTPSVPMGSR